MTAGLGVRLHGLRAGYGALRRRVVLDGLQLEAAPGQVTAIIGPNGVGKTTLFRVLLGFLKPWAGGVQVCGSRPAELRRSRGIGYLPESVALPRGFTFGGLLREGVRLAGLRGDRADRAVEVALTASGLAGTASRPLDTFSKGMGRRAALAFARLGDPPLLLLDEPLSGLDPVARALLREAIQASARSSTVLLASHDLAEVKRLAQVIVLLNRGRVQRTLDSDELDGVDLEGLVLEAERIE